MVDVGTRSRRLPTLAGYAAIVRAHLLVVVLAIALGGISGYSFSRQVDRTYQASVSIELPDVPTWVDTDPEDPAPNRTTIDTTSELLYTARVFAAVEKATALPDDDFDEELSVSAYPLSRVLIVTFEAPRPDLAVTGANAAAQGLIKERAKVLAGSQLGSARQLYDQLRTLQGKARTAKVPFGVVTRLREVMEQISDLDRRNRNAQASILDEADPAAPVSSHPELPVVTGLVVGLLAGVMYAWWRSGTSRKSTPRRPWTMMRPH